jgi:glyoxylase-like metal-dependent hydrolase (beta-lactamase superfamily II)
MTPFICKTCGVQYGPTDVPPARCVICEDERQYVGWEGQQWTTLDDMRAAGYRNDVREIEPGLHGIGTRPHFAIGQRALLVQTRSGNVLWDCQSFLDEETTEKVRALGGIDVVSASHPHFYGIMAEWARAFGATIVLPAADAQWIPCPDPAIELYDGVRELFPGVTLVQTGGHFDGSAVLHWADGADGRGVLLTGDTIMVVQDRRFVTFMRSYPNQIPLPASAVRAVVDAIRPYPFDRLYGGWWHTVVASNAQRAVERSAERYIRSISE